MASIVSIALLLCLATFTVHGSDPSEELAIKFAEPIDVATKLLYDLDQKILEILKQQQQQHEKDSKPTVLTGKNAVDSKEPDSNIAALLSNLTDLDKKLTVTFQDLQSRRRFVLGAMIRQMQSTVRRIRSNVSRMQIQLNTIETVATQMPLLRPSIQSANATIAQNVSANREIISQLEEQIHLVTSKINEIVTKLNSSLNGQATLINNPKPINPIITLNSIIQRQTQNKVNNS